MTDEDQHKAIDNAHPDPRALAIRVCAGGVAVITGGASVFSDASSATARSAAGVSRAPACANGCTPPSEHRHVQ